MSASFHSNHRDRDPASGRLEVGITIEDDRSGQTISDTVSFEVPPDFRSHNDSVAASLMTLIGSRAPVVRFNFPISEYCAAVLQDHYSLEDVGPVDSSLEPRRRGSSLGLMLSGGLDSFAIWMLLDRVLGEGGFTTVTTEFGGSYAFEELGYRSIPRNVTCRTDFRDKRFDRSGRFTGAVPVLFADYLDLDSVITGHLMNHPPLSIEPQIGGLPPRYLLWDRPFLAGGVGEVHLARALNAPSPLWIAMHGEPELFEAAWRGSAPEGSDKRFKKGLMFRINYDRSGMKRPDWLTDIPAPRRPKRLLDNPTTIPTSLYTINRLGPVALQPAYSDLGRHDFRLVDGITFDFMERYNPNITGRLPRELEGPVLVAFDHWFILPYTEREWIELAYIRELCAAAEAGGRILGRWPSGQRIAPYLKWLGSFNAAPPTASELAVDHGRVSPSL